MKKSRVFLTTGIALLTLMLAFTTLTFAQDDAAFQPVQAEKSPADAELAAANTPIRAATPTAVQLECGADMPVQIYFSDFEADNGGWSGNGDWEYGTPTYPVGLGAQSGANVWATKLMTDHTNMNPSGSSILSVTLDLSSIPTGLDAEMSWYQHLEANNSGFDRASVRVNGNTIYDSSVTGDDPAGYVLRSAELSAYAGNPSVTVEFDFFATTVVNDPGWYIDDVAVEYCPNSVARIELAKTVGTDPAVCAAETSINVAAGTDVYYCYEVTNTGGLTLTTHDLTDSELGSLLSGFAFDLAPAASVFITQSLADVQASVTNSAVWTASNVGPSDVVSASATADVSIVEADLDIAVNGSGGALAGDTVNYTAATTNPLSGTNGEATELTATLDITVSNGLDANAAVTATYYDTSMPSQLLGTITEADLTACVDAGDETTPRDPFSSTVGNGINGGPLAAGSIICTIDVSLLGDALIDTMDYSVLFQPLGESWDSETRVFFDAPPYDRSFGVNFGGFGAGAPSTAPVQGVIADSTVLQGVPTGASNPTWEVFLFESFDDSGEDPDSYLISLTLEIYGWPYITTNPTLPRSSRGSVALPSVGIASSSNFGALLSPTIVEIVSTPDWDAVCNSTTPVTWQSGGVVTDAMGLTKDDVAAITHSGSGGPGCDTVAVGLVQSDSAPVASPMVLLLLTAFCLLVTGLWMRLRRD